MAAASGFTVVGSGVVGSELALDLKAFFPDKPVNVVTRSEVGFLPRVPGAHEFVAKVCDEKGVGLVTGKVIKKTDEDGRLVTADGEHIGDKGARTCELTGCSNMTRAFHRTCPPPTSAPLPTPRLHRAPTDWATGYTPNTSYLADSRTDGAITSLLDKGGYVRVRRSFQLTGEGLEHIFAGGDMCSADNFSHGERTMAIATEHAMAISQNILLLTGRREGKLKQIKLNEHAGLSALAVSLGKDMGLLYATDPNLASFFGDAEGLRAAHGEMSEAGKAGWKELTPAIEYMKFTMFPDGLKKHLMEDDTAMMEQFHRPNVVDLE